LKKKHKKLKKKRQFWKKKEKKHVGKVKDKFSTSSILKKKFDKDNFEKKMWENTIA
jgi:uncharacterized protein Veg